MASVNIQSAKLVECLLSAEVQVPLPMVSGEVQTRLTPEEVAKVFTDHVPGVRKLLFRQQPGQYVLKFLQGAYRDGWSAFRGTALEDHLKWLMRLIVHNGHEGKPGAAQYLREVAEAFMDCQAVQARVVERIGLQIRGITNDFRGLVVALAGEYKTMALKMLAVERIAQGKAHDDATPTHYENRLTADLGEHLGLNADDVRRSLLDEHARARFARLPSQEVKTAAVRCRELFDVEALVQVLVSELNSFSESSSPNSLPRLFLDWVSENMAEKHVVFDQETFTRVDVDRALVIAVMEVVFLGQLDELTNKEYRGAAICDLFEKPHMIQSVGNDMHVEACHDADEHAEVLTTNCSNIHSNDADEHAEVPTSNCSNIRSNDADRHDELLTMNAQKAASSLNRAGLALIMQALLFRVGLIDAVGKWLESFWPLNGSMTRFGA